MSKQSWKPQEINILEHKGISYKIADNHGELLSRAKVLELWQSSKEFRLFYNQLLANCPFKAIYWEHPPSTENDLELPYEFVLLSANSLEAVSAEVLAFSDYYTEDGSVVHFSNLGGDAYLVVPCPENEKHYPHLAIFVRTASPQQIDLFWETVGIAYKNRLSKNKCWLSTAGLGVYWLHVRMDSRPKYYKFGPYKNQ